MTGAGPTGFVGEGEVFFIKAEIWPAVAVFGYYIELDKACGGLEDSRGKGCGRGGRRLLCKRRRREDE